ncbi:MAG: ATP-dependent Clp protease adapter ClpS [Bdellovibrionota bacterium]
MASGERDNRDREDHGESGTQTLVHSKPKIKEPPMYKVILLNDDFTPMDFVVHVLTKFFAKTAEEASRIMMQVHTDGRGVAGTFSHEIAETKTYLVNDYARKNKHPLKCVMEKEV